jgi:hypothetical protein
MMDAPIKKDVLFKEALNVVGRGVMGRAHDAGALNRVG